jgi:hypothetical protein
VPRSLRRWADVLKLGEPRPVIVVDEIGTAKDVASFSEWGHAVDAPTDTEPERKLGQPPFTP